MAVVTAMLTAQSRASAQPADPPPDSVCAGDQLVFSLPRFVRFDADADGLIDAGEAQPCDSLDAVFDRLDLDGDGTLTRIEYDAWPEIWQRRKRAFGDDAEGL